MNDLRAFQDAVSTAAHGMTKGEALAKAVCVKCKEPPRFKTEAGEREYGISGLCEYCWDEIFSDD